MTAHVSNVELAQRLFVPQERWGWEYVEPVSTILNPFAQGQPVWHEPPVPNVSRWERARAKAQSKLGRRLFTVVVVAVILAVAALLCGGNGTLLGTTVVLIGWSAVVATVMLPRQRIKRALHLAAHYRGALIVRFQAAQQQWQAQVQAHIYTEWQRQQAALRWYPMLPHSSPSRVDVFGGTADGWASLVATLGTSLLSQGRDILVLDFSEQNVAGGLAEFAALMHCAVSEIDLPGEFSPADLLAGLDGEQVAELVADAVHTLRQGNDAVDLRALTAELVGAVAEHLCTPLTFTRLAAGLKVLRRVYDVSAADGLLTTAEIRALTRRIDTLAHTERAQHELRFLTSVLDLIAKDESAAPPPTEPDTHANDMVGPRLWPAHGLTVITTADSHARRKDFLDCLLFHRALHALRTRSGHGEHNTVIVVGADRFGLDSLEALAKQARRIGVKLVLLLEHLRGDVERLLGGSDSAAVLMRLGNAQEATKAAEFIGRGHKFVVSQLTKQIGTTFSHGTAQSDGVQDGTSETTGTNMNTTRGRNWSDSGPSSRNASRTHGTSSSTTGSRSRTWQSTVNQSTADNTSTGTTTARVYEFAVEPTAIQGMPPTAYILVEPGRCGRRVAVGDCNPGITLLDRVSSYPRGK